MPRNAHSPCAPLQVALAWRLRQDWHARTWLTRIARQAARAVGFRRGQLSIAVVGARAMTTLHARYLGLPTPTDVLTFDLGTDPRRGILDGEIVVCAAVAWRLTKSLAPARNELALYVVHGLLHLAGYDDRTPAGFARMHAREDELLAKLGLGRIFAGDAGSSHGSRNRHAF